MNEQIKLRGITHIRTTSTLASAFWPLGRILLSRDSIEVQAMWLRLVLVPDEIVELRFYHLPLPRFIAISNNSGRYSMASFAVLRVDMLKKMMKERGFVITAESSWRPWKEDASDCDRFGFRSLADTP